MTLNPYTGAEEVECHACRKCTAELYAISYNDDGEWHQRTDGSFGENDSYLCSECLGAKSDETILAAVAKALCTEDDNWCDAVDIALSEIGIEVDQEASRADPDGHGPIAVLEDGRKIWQDEPTGELSIQEAQS